MDGNGGDAAVASVLDNYDLLPKNLLHVGYPTSLICTALVSKRLLRHASDPEFLHRFPARHLLGFYARLLLRRLRQRCVVDEDAARRARAWQEAREHQLAGVDNFLDLLDVSIS